jgi:large subunit ribosomal protein L3
VQLGVGKAKVKERLEGRSAADFAKSKVRAEGEARRVPRQQGTAARSRCRAVGHHFVPASSSTSSAITIGKGFAGSMKRWNFASRATHGLFRFRTAATARPETAMIPGRHLPGKKMAGHLGVERVTPRT